MSNPARPDFRVVTHRNWLAKHFAPVGGVQDFGMDIAPSGADTTLWWMPGHWAARAAFSGVSLPVLSCGAKWLESVPNKFTSRRVAVVKAGEVLSVYEEWNADELHVKLPEIKTDELPAQGRTAHEAWRDLFESNNTSSDTLVQLSEMMEFRFEARFFVAHGEVTAWSTYAVNGEFWDTMDYREALSFLHPQDMFEARELAEHVAQDVYAPPGYCIDVGVTTDGRPALIEANAAWSAVPYDADPVGAFAAVKASHDFTGEHAEWLFDTEQYGVVPPLRLR